MLPVIERLLHKTQAPAPLALVPERSLAPSGSLATIAEMTSYRATAKKFGFDTSAIQLGSQRAQMSNFVNTELLGVYDHESVRSYLDKKLGAGKWGWRAVNADSYDFSYFSLPMLPGPYDVGAKPVPLVVLGTMEKINNFAAAEGINTRFFISDQREIRDIPRDPDPFLAVALKTYPIDSELIIIERWDEPSYR